LTSSLLDVRRGSQVPRVANYPAYPISAAPEVIDLAATAGLKLDEWQKYVLTHGLGQDLDGGWTAPKCSCWVPRQNGKGGIIEALELAWLFLFKEDLVIHSAHQHRTAQKAYERLEKLIRRTPHMHRQVKQYRQANGEQQIELNDGRLLQYVTRSRTAVRGFSAPKVVLDEAQELNGEQMAAILPTVSAMPNWQVWFFGTPPSEPDAWAYELRADGEEGVADLAHFDWGLNLDMTKPEDRAKAADPDSWYAANPAMGERQSIQLGIRITQRTVEGEHRPSGLGKLFPQERLGVWQPRRIGGGVIDPAKWKDMQDADSQREGDLSIGVDIAHLRDHASIVVYGTRDDGLGHVRLVDYAEGTDWVIPRLTKLCAALDPVAVAMGRGTYESLKEELGTAGLKVPDDPEEPRRGDLIVTTAIDMAAACAQVIDAVRIKSFRVVPAPQLDAAVAGAKTRQAGDTIAWARGTEACEISPVGGMTVARWGHLTRLPMLSTTYDPMSQIF
jgi:hypothetical protein